MITVVLDATRTLVDSDIYKPLLYRSMRNQSTFYIKNEETNKINKIKSIIKYYSQNDYELIILLDLMQNNESLFEKIHSINKDVLSNVFIDTKKAAKIRYVVLDYINGNFMKEEQELVKNIEIIQNNEGLKGYLDNIKKANISITWPDMFKDEEVFSAIDLFVEKMIPNSEIDMFTLNKQPNEENEEFFKNIYLKLYGFINLIAEGTIEEDLAVCCFRELPIYNLNIELNKDAIIETAKRYLLNLEKEEEILDLNTSEKIEYMALFDENDELDKEQKKTIEKMKQIKLQIKKAKVTLFSNIKDLKGLESYVENVKDEYKYKTRKLNSLYGLECKNVRDDLNKGFKDIKLEVKERFEIENKIKEEKEKIEKLKYKKSKLIVGSKKVIEEFETFLEKQRKIVEDAINKRQIISESFLYQIIFLIVYIFIIFAVMKKDYVFGELMKGNMLKISIVIFIIWLFSLFLISTIQKIKVKLVYKKVNKKLQNLFMELTENQRNGIESIDLGRKLIKSKKTISHLTELLNKSNEKIEKILKHKDKIKRHINFCGLISNDILLDGSIEINDLDSTYSINIDEFVSYKNKAYSFVDYVVNNKYSFSYKGAKTAHIVKKENAGTYISYVSIG